MITIRVVLYKAELLSILLTITSRKLLLLFWRKSHILPGVMTYVCWGTFVFLDLTIYHYFLLVSRSKGFMYMFIIILASA